MHFSRPGRPGRLVAYLRSSNAACADQTNHHPSDLELQPSYSCGGCPANLAELLSHRSTRIPSPVTSTVMLTIYAIHSPSFQNPVLAIILATADVSCLGSGGGLQTAVGEVRPTRFNSGTKRFTPIRLKPPGRLNK